LIKKTTLIIMKTDVEKKVLITYINRCTLLQTYPLKSNSKYARRH